MIVSYNEESGYGQDVLELIAMCVHLQEGTKNLGQVKQQLKEICGKTQTIGYKLSLSPESRLEYLGVDE